MPEHPLSLLDRALHVSHGVVEEHDAAQTDMRIAALQAHAVRLEGELDARTWKALVRYFRSAQGEAARAMLARLSSAERNVREAGLRDLQRHLRERGERQTPLDDEAIFRRILGRPTREQIGLQRRAASRWLRMTRADTDRTLRSAFGEKATVREAIERASAASSARVGSIGRISETEGVRAYNSAREHGLVTVSRHKPGLYKRWTEKVDDAGRPMDNRVAVDSVVMHGQVALPADYFRMPSGAPVPGFLQGGKWLCPPNRPNCRACLTAWRESWRVPGYMLIDGRRVNV